MHVLHIIASLDLKTGGPPAALAGLAKAQIQAGLRVSIAAGSSAGTDDRLADQLSADGISVTLISPVTGKLARHPDLPRIVSQQVTGCDIVHIHGLWEEIQHQAARAAARSRIPYIIRPCGMLDPWSLRQSQLKKWIYLTWRLRRNLDRAAALHFTATIERDLTRPLRLKAPAIVEPNGVDLAEFENPPPAGSFRAKFPQSQGRPLVLFMSRLHHKKGLDLLIPAFARLRDTQAMLAIAGPDSDGYRAVVEKMIADAGIADRVFFTGMLWRESRVAALADADLFVLPSYQENFGVVVVEALAAGTPVVISDQVNLYPDVLEAGVGGVVALKVEPLAAELDRWLADESLRKSAGEKSRIFARNRFDWRKIAERWKEHYGHLTRDSRFSMPPVG